MTQNRSRRVVIVENESLPIQACELILKTYFKNVEISGYQDVFKAWWEISGAAPDMLITSAFLPGVEARGLVDRLLARKPVYPVIVISGFSEPEWIRKYACQGVYVRFLNLPFDVRTFVDLVSASLDTPPDPPAPSPLPH